MLVIIFICLIILLIYTVWLIIILKGWIKLKVPELAIDDPVMPVSVVIPFRNESHQIGFLLDSLFAEIVDESTSEIILVDDQSDDDSFEIVHQKIAGRKNCLLLSTQKSGKKNALKTGIQKAKNTWIVTLDADVQVPSGWHLRITKHCASSQVSMLILPLLINEQDTFIGACQSLEFMSISGITAGSASNKSPLLCNGAHLAFKKEVYEQSLSRRTDEHISSGDDMFLLSDVKKHDSVMWVHDSKIAVVINAETNLKSLINQRIRWASKTASIPDFSLKCAGLIVALTNFAVIASWIVILLEPRFFIYGINVTVLKISNDYHLTKKVASWLCKTRLMRFFIPLSLIYPFYAILIPLAGLFYKPKWKGRMIKT